MKPTATYLATIVAAASIATAAPISRYIPIPGGYHRGAAPTALLRSTSVPVTSLGKASEDAASVTFGKLERANSKTNPVNSKLVNLDHMVLTDPELLAQTKKLKGSVLDFKTVSPIDSLGKVKGSWALEVSNLLSNDIERSGAVRVLKGASVLL